MQHEQKKSNRFKVAVIAACVAALAVGGVFAYLTDMKQKTNTFTVVTTESFNSAVELTEPQWDAAVQANPQHGKNITPGQVIVKDPTIKNASTGDAWMFLKVTVPQANVQAEGDLSAKTQNLFSFEVDPAFVEIKSGTTDGVYVYALGDGNTPSKAQAAGTLFSNIKYLNVKSGTVPGTLNVDVVGYAISAGGLATAQAAWGEVEKVYPAA